MSAPPDKKPLDLAILDAAWRSHNPGPCLHIHEEVGTNWHPKVVWRRMEALYERGLLECGVSLSTGWLTDTGIKRLEELKDIPPKIKDA